MSTQQAEYERPRGGVAQLAAVAEDDEDDEYHPEIVPIPEGEVTIGAGSKEEMGEPTPTEWERDPLKRATELGVFDNAKLIRGNAGINPHIGMDEQPSPDDIVGHAGTFSYEEGRGPVSNGDGVILDDHLAQLVDHGLLEISPDMFRHLGEFDETLADGEGAYSVEEIVACPRMTILDRGASPNAELGPAETEALAALPEYDDITTEQLAAVGDAVRWESDAGGEREPSDVRYGVVVDGLQDGAEDSLLVAVYQANQDYDGWETRNEQNTIKEENLETVGNDGKASLPSVADVIGTEQNAMPAPLADHTDSLVEQLGQLHYLRFWPDPVPGMESDTAGAFEMAANAVDTIDGVTSILRTDTDDEGAVRDGELFAIIDPDQAPLGTLNDDLVSALDETPFAVGGAFNWVPELQTEHLAAGDVGAAASNEEHSNQPIGADTDPSDPAADDNTPSNMSDDPDIGDMSIEQLAAANDEVATLKDDKETLETEKSDLRDEKKTLEGEVDEKDDRIDELEDEAEFSRRQAAMIAAGGNESVADTLVDSERSGDELAEMALDSDHGPEVLAGVESEEENTEPEEEQLSPRERLQEQLAGTSGPRGGASDERTTSDNGGGEATQEQLAAAEERSLAIMSSTDLRAVQNEGTSKREYVQEEYDVDPVQFDTKDELRAAAQRKGGAN